MENIHQLRNVYNFINFSKISEKPVEIPDEDKLQIMLEKNNHIDITGNHLSKDIRIYKKGGSSENSTKVITFIDSSEKDLILIKANWQKKRIYEKREGVDVYLLLYTDFNYDITPIYASMKPSLVINEDYFKEFGLFGILPENIPKIKDEDILVKWMLLRRGDVIKLIYNKNIESIVYKEVIKSQINNKIKK